MFSFMKIKRFIVGLFNLILIEIFSFLIVRVLHLASMPLIQGLSQPAFFVDTDKPYGVWHYKNITTHHIGPNWNVEYKFNSEGARGNEWDKKYEDERFLFLGDSFVEGYGLEQKDRLSDQVEHELGIECMNFAASGMGQTQMRLVYEEFGPMYDHDIIFLSFYPYNDFLDNSYANHLTIFKNRYRPYMVKGSDGEFHLTHYLEKPEQSEYHYSKIGTESYRRHLGVILRSDQTFSEKLYRIFVEFTYTGSIVKSIREKLKNRIHHKTLKKFSEKMDYLENKNQDDWAILQYELEQIKKLADTKKVVLMLIPNPNDFKYIEEKGRDSFVQTNLKTIADGLGIVMVDFLKEMSDYDNLYIRNDDHWNANGNKIAMKILIQKLKENHLIQ